MKTFLLLISFFLFFSPGQSQTYNSSCIPSGNMQSIYRNDAYRLATKRVNDINSTWKDSVMIPEIYIDSIAKGLYAIQNMHNSAIRDTIMTKFGFSTFSNFNYQADSSHIYTAGGDWHYAYFLKKIRVTNFNNATAAALDSINYLKNRYNLVQTPVNPSGPYELLSPVAINVPALIKQFKLISGIQYADPFGYIGSGDYITADFINGDILLTYGIGCGDCPSGCTFGRKWNFKVNTSSDCSVNYLSASNLGLAEVMPLDDLDFTSCMGTVVPIELTSISVSKKNNYQLVEWQMAMEDNVTKYVIERSGNGINYTSIGKIDVVNPSSGAINYSWIDSDLISGHNFYRIRIIDRSGAVKYSPVASLYIKSKTSIRVFPTIVQGNSINIQFSKVNKDNYFIDLLNTAGQKIFSKEIDVNADVLSMKLQIPVALSSGTYIVSIHSKTIQQNQLIYVSGK